MTDVLGVIRSATDLEFGICPYSAVSKRLIACRAAERLPKDAKTVILFLFPYKVNAAPPKNISRYAAVPDYHAVCGERLEKIAAALKASFPQNEFACFADNSPIPEVSAAVAAGLGCRGENGLLITEKYGSFVFIGEIVTDLEVPSEIKSERCIGCGKCRAACPVSLDKSRCLSALTQKKGELSAAEIEKLRSLGSIWGCDICQEVCPQNRTPAAPLAEFSAGYRDEYVLGEDGTDRAYNWRRGAIERNATFKKKRP